MGSRTSRDRPGAGTRSPDASCPQPKHRRPIFGCCARSPHICAPAKGRPQRHVHPRLRRGPQSPGRDPGEPGIARVLSRRTRSGQRCGQLSTGLGALIPHERFRVDAPTPKRYRISGRRGQGSGRRRCQRRHLYGNEPDRCGRKSARSDVPVLKAQPPVESAGGMGATPVATSCLMESKSGSSGSTPLSGINSTLVSGRSFVFEASSTK